MFSFLEPSSTLLVLQGDHLDLAVRVDAEWEEQIVLSRDPHSRSLDNGLGLDVSEATSSTTEVSIDGVSVLDDVVEYLKKTPWAFLRRDVCTIFELFALIQVIYTCGSPSKNVLKLPVLPVPSPASTSTS